MEVQDPACRDALAILQDVVQLCELMRGETESCSFRSVCSDCFTGVAMQHLCAPNPSESLPSRELLPFIDKSLRSSASNATQMEENGRNDIVASAAAAAAATEAAKLSMALAEERSAGMAELQARLGEQANTMAAKDAETQALLAKNASLVRALEEKQPGKLQSAGASLVQSGVQVIPSSELDLDLSNKEQLGSGVYSEVYKTSRQVALKALRGRFSQQRFREFKHEAEILQLVQGSSGVCRLHGICIDSLPNLFLITEPVCGGTLEAYLQTTQSKGVPLERGVPLARSIANAMKDVHAKGVVHRDLKPSNCVLTEYDNKTIKLVDFGLARLIQGDCIPAEEHDGAGTPMYQAPEVLQNAGVGTAADVFSFGIIMWEMISGEIPYEGLSLNDMRMAVMAGARPPIQGGWNQEWVDIMRSCWASEAVKRPTFAVIEQLLGRMMAQRQPAPGPQVNLSEAGAVQQLVQQAAGASGAPGFVQQQQQHAGGGTGRGMPPGAQAFSISSPQPRVMHTQALQTQEHPLQSQQMHHQQQHMPPPGMQQVQQQLAGTKLSPGIKTMAGSQYGGIVHDMEEM